MRTFVRPVGRCPTGKSRYEDEIAAKVVIAAAQAPDVIDQRREGRAYPCSQCQGWHVTSQTQRTRKGKS